MAGAPCGAERLAPFPSPDRSQRLPASCTSRQPERPLCPVSPTPIATDVKGERRFISTIARRLDSLGAITRGQRDSQSAMGEDGAMFMEDAVKNSVRLRAYDDKTYAAQNTKEPTQKQQTAETHQKNDRQIATNEKTQGIRFGI